MTCLREHTDGADLLIGYLEDTLSEAQRRELEEHAAACAECRELLAVQATLDEYEAPEVSPDFDSKLYARIAADRAKRPWWQFSGWKMMIPAAMAAMLAVGIWIRQPEPPVVVEEGPKQARIDPDVQQLEQALEDLELLMPISDAGDSM